MQSISRLALAVAMPLALSVTMAHAQTPGESNEGSGESPRAISTGTPPDPAEVSPRAVPIVEDPADLAQVGREILDEEAVRERFGATVYRSDGTVTTIEASDEIVRAFMGAGTGQEPGPQLDGERPRFVGPDDRRQQVMDPNSYPVTAVGLLYSTYAGGGGSCSATLIGPSTLITAAHCVFDHDQGWPQNIQYVPAMLDEQTMPYGVWEFDTAYVLPAYIQNYQGDYGSVVPSDLAVVTLQAPIGNELGWLGFASSEGMTAFDATILSYPGDKPFGTLWRSTCNIQLNEQFANELVFVHFCETYAGSSGGSLYAYYPGENERRIYGVNVAEVQGEGGFNIAVRLNDVYFQWVAERWK